MISIIIEEGFGFEQDVRELLMAFYPGEDFIYEEDEASLLCVRAARDRLSISFKDGGLPVSVKLTPTGDRAKGKSELKRSLYLMLSEHTGRKLPWGTLTGIRPVKLYEKERMQAAADMARLHGSRAFAVGETGSSFEASEEMEALIETAAKERMRREYFISERKLSLLSETAMRERSALYGIDVEGGFSLYVNIPFCPSTCLYCSFTSNPIDRFRDRVEEYIEAMKRELWIISSGQRGELCSSSPIAGKKLQTIYIGGGTPTALSAEQLDRLICMIETEMDLSSLKEFTVEAGRPDSIDREKLRTLKRHGIGRISINPQTMNDKTLKLIGRRHTASEVEEAFGLAREEGFDDINMDVIMGLPMEMIEDVNYTLSRIAGLKPESLTVHALAVKRAARLSTEGLAYAGLPRAGAEEASRMIELGADCAASLNMRPYYLYRQKNMAGNQENVGYCIPGKENLYNILMMEEKHSVVGIGAGASTKLIVPNEDPSLFGGNTDRVERQENMKNISSDLERIDEVLEKKRRFLKGAG